MATIQGLAEAPVVALLGARQVGKTTLAEQVMSSWPGTATLFDLEVAASREALSRTPERVLRECEGLVVIDEVQRLPALFEVLRPLCDDRNRKAVFLLLRSASWDLTRIDIRHLRLMPKRSGHSDSNVIHRCGRSIPRRRLPHVAGCLMSPTASLCTEPSLAAGHSHTAERHLDSGTCPTTRPRSVEQ